MRGAELSSERRRFALLYEKTYGESFCVKQWEKKIHYVDDKTCGWIFLCYPLREEDMLSWLRIRIMVRGSVLSSERRSSVVLCEQ